MYKKIIDSLIAFAYLFGIGIMIVVLIGSINYWQTLFDAKNTNQMLFYMGLLIAIIHTITDFIAEFIREIAKSLRNIFYKKPKGRKE